MRNFQASELIQLGVSGGVRSFSDNQQSILLKLQGALRDSNLLAELSVFLHLDDTGVTDQLLKEPVSRNSSADSMLRVKNASAHFLQQVSPLTAIELRALSELQLAELVTKRAWLHLLLINHQSAYGRYLLDLSYKKLIFINNYRINDTSGNTVKGLLTAAVPNSVFKEHLRDFTAYLAGILTLAVGVMVCAAQWPEQLQTLQVWSLSSGVSYSTALALLVSSLAVISFKFFSSVISHYKETDNQGRKNNKDNTAKVLPNMRLSPSRVVAGCTGPLLLGLGTGVSATAGFGAFGVTVFLDGIYNSFASPFWFSQILFSVSCYLLAWFWARIPLGIGTIPSLFLIGPAISMGATLGQQDLSFSGNLIAFAVGTLVFSFGIAMTAAAALGPDGKTALSLAAEKKSGWPIPLSAFFFNLSFIAIGVTLGGNFGIATIMNLVLVPVLLHTFIPPLRRYLSNTTR